MRNNTHSPSTDALFFSRTWDFLNVYLEKQAGRSPATRESYRDSLTVFKNYLISQLGKSIGTFRFSDCTKECVYSFREYLLKNGIEASSVNVRVAAIRAYLYYAADRDISIQSVALAIGQISPCKTVKKENPVLTEEALAALLSAPPNTRTGVRDRAILILLYDTAVRVSELLDIKIGNIELESNDTNIFIKGKGKKERRVSLTEKGARHLKEYLRLFHPNASKDDYLFSTTIKGVTDRMSVGNVQRIVKKYAEQVRKSGIDIPDSVHCHMLRRTRATNLYQDGVAIDLVSTILGHARIDTTRTHYAKPSVEQLRQAMESVPTPVSEEKPLWEGNEQEMARICGLR